MKLVDEKLIELLFNSAESFVSEDEGDLELPFDFDEELPPYPILLSLLLDWAKSPAAAQTDRHPAFEALIINALRHLRYGIRQNNEEAQEWWVKLQDTLRAALKEQNSLLCRTLIRSFADLDFLLPEELILPAAEWHFENFQHFAQGAESGTNLVEFPQQPDAVLNNMLDVLEPKTASEIYEVLKPELHYLPIESVGLIAQQLLSSNISLVCNTALMLLLHPRVAVREAVVDTLSNQELLTNIDATGRNRLITLRNYLPKNQSDRLDKVIKFLNRRDLGTPQTSQSNIQIWASPMDGAGASALTALRSVGSHWQVSGIILKENVGIVDCWETPFIKKSEAKKTLAMVRENLPSMVLINEDYLGKVLPHYLFFNKVSGELPEPVLLEWLEKLGNGLWRPNRFDYSQWLEKMEPELSNDDQHAGFLRCVRWFDRERDSIRWWEQSEKIDELVEQLLSSNDDPFDEDKILEQVFAPFRQKWAERFVHLSLWAQCSTSTKKPRWQDFALLALEINRETAIPDLPIIHAVIEDTLHAAAQRLQEETDGAGNWFEDDMEEEWDMEDWNDGEGLPYTPDLFGSNLAAPAKSQKVGRNLPCPCGSGKKYKRCCGK